MAVETLEFSESLNPNTEFLNGRGFWAFYVSVVILCHFSIRILLAIAFPSLVPHSFTVTSFAHMIITLYAMHWVKGASFASPFFAATDNGKYDKLTWWEQVDKGQQNTSKKKILTTFPIVLGVIACYEAGWETQWILFNCLITFVAILGKMPFMHRARILGINK